MPASYALTVEQLGTLAEKTLVNARELLDEAKALGLLGHYPRAMSLAVLAAEEFGKHMMCFGAVGLRDDDEEMWKDFHIRFRNHKPKYENLFAMAVSMLPENVDKEAFLAEITKHVSADQARKMAGLYVDLTEDGRATHPAEVIGPDEAKAAIMVYDRVLSMWEALWEDEVFEDVFAEGLSRGAGELRYALIEDDDETVRRYFKFEEE